MRKSFLKSAVAGLLTLAVVGTSVALPSASVVTDTSAYTGTNYENDYEYTYTSMALGTNTTIYHNATTSNDSRYDEDIYGFCAYGEDYTQNSDYVKTAIDRAEMLAAYKSYAATTDSKWDDAEAADYEADATSNITESFTSQAVYYGYERTEVANSNPVTYTYTYYKIAANPNISYSVESSNPAIVSATPYAPAQNGGDEYRTQVSSAKLLANAPSNGAYVTVKMIRKNNATGASTMSVYYVTVTKTELNTTSVRTTIIGKAQDSGQFVSVTNDYGSHSVSYKDATTNEYKDFSYSFSNSVYNSTTKETDYTYTAVTYALVSSNPAVVEPRSESGLAYKINGVGAATLTVKQINQTLTQSTSLDADGKTVTTYTLGEKTESVLGNVAVTIMGDDTSADYEDINKEVAIGESYQIQLGHSYSTQANFTYTSNKKKIASVDANGVVKAKKKGTAKITVKLTYNDGRVSVNNKKVATVTVKVKKAKVSVGGRTQVVTIGDNTYCVPVSYRNPNKYYTYAVSNKKIASVSKQGLVTGKKAGETTVTVYEQKNTKKKAKKTKVGEYTLYVRKAATDDIYFNSSLYERKGGIAATTALMSVAKGVKFDLNDYLKGDTDYVGDLKVTYKSSKKGVAAVSKAGVVSAKKNGTTTITVKSGAYKKKLTLKVVTADTSTTAKSKQAVAAARLSKLSSVVGLTSGKEISKFNKAKTLVNNYIAAYNAYYDVTINNKTDKSEENWVGGTSADVEKDNYIAVPNADLLSDAETILDNYFKYTKADYSVDASYKVSNFSGKTGTVTFSDKLTKNDILKYCYDKSLPYSTSVAVRYDAKYAAANEQYVSVPVKETGLRVAQNATTGAFEAVTEDYPMNAAGQYVSRKYKQTVEITYTKETYDYDADGYVTKTEKVTGYIDPAKSEDKDNSIGTIYDSADNVIGHIYTSGVYIESKTINDVYYYTASITAVTAEEVIEEVNYHYINVGGSYNVSALVTRKAGSKTGKLILADDVDIYNNYGHSVTSVEDENYKENSTFYALSPTVVNGKLTVDGITVKNVTYTRQ